MHYSILRSFRWNRVTLPNRWLTSGEYRRTLPVAPLIGDQRCYGEATAELPTYPAGLAGGNKNCLALKAVFALI